MGKKIDLKIDIEALDIVKHKLAVSIKAMRKTVDAEKKKAQEKIDLLGLDSKEGIIEAYGWALISEEEYYNLMQQLETETANEKALAMLRQLYSETAEEVRYLRYEMLPDAEKEKIVASEAKWREEHRREVSENG